MAKKSPAVWVYDGVKAKYRPIPAISREAFEGAREQGLVDSKFERLNIQDKKKKISSHITTRWAKSYEGAMVLCGGEEQVLLDLFNFAFVQKTQKEPETSKAKLRARKPEQGMLAAARGLVQGGHAETVEEALEILAKAIKKS